MMKLSSVCYIEKGNTPIQNSNAGDYPLVVTSEERLTSDKFQFDSQAVCIPMVSSTGHGHASLKRVHYQNGKFALGNILCALISKDESVLMTKYLYIYLQFYKDDLLVPLMKGSANVSLSLSSLKNLEIPIPDIQIQNRILREYEFIGNSVSNIKSKIAEIKINYDLLISSIISKAISNQYSDKYRLNELFNIEKGTLQSSKAVSGHYDFITASETWKTHNEFTHDCEAIIFAMGASGSLGRTHYVNGQFITSDLCFILTQRKDLNLNFYNYLFRYERQRIVKETATGSSKLAINQKNFSNIYLAYIKKSIQDDCWEKITKIVSAKTQIEQLENLVNNLINVTIDRLFKT